MYNYLAACKGDFFKYFGLRDYETICETFERYIKKLNVPRGIKINNAPEVFHGFKGDLQFSRLINF